MMKSHDDLAMNVGRQGASQMADEAAALRIHAMLARPPWSQNCAIAVTVRDAVVTLDGTCSDDDCLATIEQAVLAVAPVTTVRSRLAWVLPDCGIGVCH